MNGFERRKKQAQIEYHGEKSLERDSTQSADTSNAKHSLEKDDNHSTFIENVQSDIEINTRDLYSILVPFKKPSIDIFRPHTIYE